MPALPGEGDGMILGLTGGIASGKTTVAQMLIRLGARLIEADDLARQVVEPGTEGLRKVVCAFGEEILDADGKLRRDLLGKIVFSDPVKLRLLNSVLHPVMAVEAKKQLASLSRQGTAVLAGSLLFEAGWEKLVDKMLLVYVDSKTQLSRLMARDGLSRLEAQARISSQLPLEEKLAKADYLIDTSRPLADVQKQVEAIWREIHEKKDSANRA